MDKNELQFILQEGEGFKIEFKTSFDKSLVREIVAFANASGGRIFLGIDDMGLVRGVKVLNKLKSQIQDIGRNCDPGIKIDFETFEYDSKIVLAVVVGEGDNKPYQCSTGFYLRQGSSFQKLSRDEIIEFEIKTARRKEIPQYPEEAIRETIVNAIMHRDYFDDSGDVVIEVFRNKLLISNPGGLVKSLKPEDFGSISRLQNSLIANLLVRTIYVEKLGTGISRIRIAMEKSGLPEPKFDYNYSFFVTLYDRANLHGVVNGAVGVVNGVAGRKSLLLRYLRKEGRIRIKEYQDLVSVSFRTTQRDLSQFQREGVIRFRGAPKTGHYELIR